jgi:hypothetical protein
MALYRKRELQPWPAGQTGISFWPCSLPFSVIDGIELG